MRIPALDGLRGLAVLAAIALHTAGFGGGRSGVEILFALSGFLVGGQLLDTPAAPGWWRPFYLRRIARTWPLYFVVAALVVVTGNGAQPGWWRFVTFTANFEMTPAQRTAVEVLASIGVVEHAYLLFPWLLVGRTPRDSGLALLALSVVAMMSRYVVVQQFDQWIAYSWTPCRLDGFAIGVLAAWVHRYRREWIRYAAPIAIYAIPLKLLSSGDPWGRTTLGAALLWQPLVAIATAATVLSLANGGLQYLGRGLAHPLPRALGTISYGLYLLHPLVAERLSLTPGWGLMLATTACSTVLAFISWRLIEQPILGRSAARAAQSPHTMR